MAELSTVARPYAEAVFEIARAGDMKAWSQALAEMAMVAADPQMQAAIGDPNIANDALYALFTGVLKSAQTEATRAFARTLVDNDRLALLPEIARQFEKLKNAHEGSAEALITSAYALDDTQVSSLVAALEQRFGVKLKPRVAVDPSLIGGVRVEVGDQVLDTSVRARLAEMRTALSAA